jgi:hypothetical protein
MVLQYSSERPARTSSDKYGEFVITPALMMGMDDTIIDRIAFGGSQGVGRIVFVLMPSETPFSGRVVPYRTCFCMR